MFRTSSLFTRSSALFSWFFVKDCLLVLKNRTRRFGNRAAVPAAEKQSLKETRAQRVSAKLVQHPDNLDKSSVTPFLNLLRMPPSDGVILHHTSVHDGAAPLSGIETEFSRIGKTDPVSRRMGGQEPHSCHQCGRGCPGSSSASKLIVLSDEKQPSSSQVAPKTCGARDQNELHSGPDARRDAEEADKVRWEKILCNFFVKSPTPWAHSWRSSLAIRR